MGREDTNGQAISEDQSPVHVSVVVPLFNKEDVVERTLTSVLSQDVSDFEVIVVNDGSTDDSRTVVSRIADSRIRIVDQSNVGVGAARNRGIKEARGILIAFCDADDEWKPGFLGSILRLEGRFPDCRVFGTGYVFREPGGRERRQLLVGMPEDPWEGVIVNYFEAAYRSDGPLFVSAFAAHKEALEQTGGFPERVRIGEDLLGLVRLVVRYQVAFSTTPEVAFNMRGQYPARPVRFPDTPDVVGAELARIASSAQPAMRRDLRRFVALWHRMRGTIFTYHGQRGQATRELLRAVRYAPGEKKLYAGLALAALPTRPREAVLRRLGQWRDRRRS